MANEIHISGSGVTTLGRALYINGNGIDRTKIIADSYTALINSSSGQVISVNDCCINFSVAGPSETSTGARLHNVLVDGATSQQVAGGASIIGCATLITGSTFKNCRFSGTASNSRGCVDAYPLGGTISNCLFLAQGQWMTAVFCYGTTLSDCTFSTSNTGNVNVYNRAISTNVNRCAFDHTNLVFNGWSITASNYVWVKVTDSYFDTATITTQDPNNLLEFYGKNTMNNITISGTGRITVNAGSITGSEEGQSWKINLAGSTNRIGNHGEISGCTITGKSYSTGCLYLYGGSRLVNSLITGNAMTVNAGQVEVENNASKSPVLIKGTSITGNTRGSYGGAFDALTTYGRVLLVDSIVDGCYINVNSRTWIYFNNITFPRAGRLYTEIPVGQYSYYAPSVRIEDGSTVSVLNNTLGDSNYCFYSPCIAVGVQSSDGTFFANNGTFTFVKKNGTSIQIKGIGTYVRIDGVNDFSPIYQITSTAASGSGSLQYGILTATEKWLVPMPNMTTASAVVSTAITNKPVFFMNAAGAPIFGGSISLPASTTVSCKYDSDIEASTVSVSGGSITAAGTCYIRGNLCANDKWDIVSGATVIGTGVGSIIRGTTYSSIYGKSITLKYVTVYNCNYESSTINFVGCRLYRQTAVGKALSALLIRNSGTVSNCILDANGNTIIHSDGAFLYVKDSTFSNGTPTYGGAPTTFDNCTFVSTSNALGWLAMGKIKTFLNNKALHGYLYQGNTNYPTGIIVFDKFNKWDGYLHATVTGGTVCLVSGSTLSVQGNANSVIFSGVAIRVGTISGSAITITGTATIITTSGTTYTVSGSGTYLNNDGTTDLTRA